ncbi:hypothetical protein GCM10011357_26370 [Lacimicrobium alkaliphilum]|uniref:Beta-carotene 15,15'-monooxygenase n=2 Tax=Lacimicrobium alkaliphilum TaxID=1526571 RepID=A0ABQ1RJW1_9ALTE|nr:hypothetical protein GCM10011357_26370 [Lacimicrobium alkaliphilum]
MGIGLVALFPMALPALVMLPLLSLGVLADPQTQSSLYLNTLWGYLLLLYSWMNFQRDGIYAARYQLYLKALPTNPAFKSLCDWGLIIYAANVFILGPVLLLIIVLVQQSGTLTSANSPAFLAELIPLLALVILSAYYGFIAVNNTLPWISLLVFPFLAFTWPEELSKLQWLLLWVIAIVTERFMPAVSIPSGNWPHGLFRLFLRADISSPGGEKLRLIALLLLIALTRISASSLHPDVQPYLLNLVCFLSALILASSLFGIQALRERYHLYLRSLSGGEFAQLAWGVTYVFLKTLIGVILIALAGIFEVVQWGLWLLFYTGALAGILWRPKWFLFVPCLVAIVVFLAA